jgi:N-acetyl-gamma-glutamyl-phosphate reductase
MDKMMKVAVLGASGYTGAELLRFLVRHPHISITALTADRKAGQAMAEVFPQFTGIDLPRLTTIADMDFSDIDFVFCALPHGTTQQVILDVLDRKPGLRIVDLSADFRLENPDDYALWYGHPHQALSLQHEAVFGLTEHYRSRIASARLVANPGCHSSTSILAIVPLLKAGLIDPDSIVIDSKTGMSGAGRAAKEEMLFSEISTGVHAYGVGKHRHTAELDQEFSKAAGRSVTPSFTPHILPMNRGIYATLYVRMASGVSAGDLHATLSSVYANEAFVQVLPLGTAPQSRHVLGANQAHLGVIADRMKDRAILIATTDNLVKGASGQAIQNMNVMCGWPETLGLNAVAVFP